MVRDGMHRLNVYTAVEQVIFYVSQLYHVAIEFQTVKSCSEDNIKFSPYSKTLYYKLRPKFC